MALLIDGYNLLHVTALFGRPGSGLEGAREALLRFLAATLDERERPSTTIVFDAAAAPPGLPRMLQRDGMTIRFASDYEDADALIEELIEAFPAPRTLTVVSSDHRVQRAARRRRAAYVDSDSWFNDAIRRRRAERSPPSATRRQGPLSEDEVNFWMSEFAVAENEGDEIAADPEKAAPLDQDAGSGKAPGADQSKDLREKLPQGEIPDDLANPFPPGYGEDLLT